MREHSQTYGNSKTQNKQFHVALSVKEHEMDRYELGEFAERFMERMGYGGQQQLDEQAVQSLGNVEIIALARLGSHVGHVLGRKFLDGAQHGVGTWDAGVRTVGKGVAEEQVDVLHAVAAAEIDSEEGAYDLAVLVAEQGAADAQYPVYHIAQKSIEFVQYKIYSAKSGYFLIFCAIFAMSVGVLLTCFCTTKVSEISDMTKS